MSGHRPFSELVDKMPPARRARIEKRVQRTLQQMRLNELRKASNLSQEAIAKKLKMKQPAVSKIENSKDLSLDKLKRYVRATGAELHLYATYPNGKKVDITSWAGL